MINILQTMQMEIIKKAKIRRVIENMSNTSFNSQIGIKETII